MKQRNVIKQTAMLLIALYALVCGIALGVGIAFIHRSNIIQRATNTTLALPTTLMDRKGRVITTFFSHENRALLSFKNTPSILMQALITREDQTFFKHHGFSVRGTSRAAFNLLVGNYISGGSTLSQQVAGVLYADRREFSIMRKLKELWWSLQIERSWSKQEILEEYLNKMYFGHGNYGVDTASKYFFGHGASDINSAEAVMLVIQLASPVKYSPFKNPNVARNRQTEILRQMVYRGYITKEQSDLDFNTYWDNYDFTREGFSSAFLERDDKAPYFSEYIRQILKSELGFSKNEINTGGYTIYTTLDLDIQKQARKNFDEGLKKANRIYKSNNKYSKNQQKTVLPTVALLSHLFDGSNNFFHRSTLQAQESKALFVTNIQPIIALTHLIFEASPNSLSAYVINAARAQSQKSFQEETVEGALITIENNTGHIVSMIGGSKFDVTNQFNRATNAFVQPGSSFKPLYYAAALEEKSITPSTILWDSPVVFYNDDGEAYAPRNYKGEWKGAVTVRQALSRSMNVPSLKVLNKVGFDKALEISAGLLTIPKEQWKSSGLVKKFPVGLGIASVSPLAMARAYATIANQGRAQPTIAVRYIKDRNGKIIQQTETSTKAAYNVKNKQIISPQSAYVLTTILESTVQSGTLAYAKNVAGGFTHPTAGKTGTTQNWTDAWTLGFTPYYTTALWYGFDRGNQSLGTNQTGAITAGPIWAKYMKAINEKKPYKDFEKPNGIVTVQINPLNDTLAVRTSPIRRREIYIAGTEPTQYDNQKSEIEKEEALVERLERATWNLSIPFDNTSVFDTESLKDNTDTLSKTRNSNSPIDIQLSTPSRKQLKSKKLLNNETETSTQGNPLLDQ